MFKKESSLLIFLLFLILTLFVSYAVFDMQSKKSIFTRIEILQEEITALKNTPPSTKIISPSTSSQDIVSVVKKVQPSVVSIIASKELTRYRQRNPFFFSDPFFDNFFGFPQQFEEPQIQQNETEKVKVGGGSGFIYSQNGYIITNKHVIQDDSAEYTVVLHDGTEFLAEVIAKDPFNDIAIIKIDPKETILVPVSLGDSSKIEVGEKVVAIGNALAEFQNTVTTGIVSAIGRKIVAGNQFNQEEIQNLIQTDAAINPGNSGGPLVNIRGEVIGMNTAIADGANGIGFALPINDIRFIAKNVETHGKYIRPYIGIKYIMLNEKIAEEYELTQKEGAYIIGSEKERAVLKGSPADLAGILEEDIIIKIDGQEINKDYDVIRAIAEKIAGEEILITVLRNNTEKEIPLTLGEYPQQ
jgi:serine protease Do